MEPILDFIEIKFAINDEQIIGPIKESEFYMWLKNNSKESITSISSLKYKIDGENYYFRIDRSKIPSLNKWEAQDAYPKNDDNTLYFTFEWKRGMDFRLDFERKLNVEIEKETYNPLCVCKQQKNATEIVSANTSLSK